MCLYSLVSGHWDLLKLATAIWDGPKLLASGFKMYLFVFKHTFFYVLIQNMKKWAELEKKTLERRHKGTPTSFHVSSIINREIKFSKYIIWFLFKTFIKVMCDVCSECSLCCSTARDLANSFALSVPRYFGIFFETL